jgi:hypothetical protein
MLNPLLFALDMFTIGAGVAGPLERAQQVDEFLTRYGLDATNLTREQRFTLIREEMNRRFSLKRFYLITVVSACVICFAMAVFFAKGRDLQEGVTGGPATGGGGSPYKLTVSWKQVSLDQDDRRTHTKQFEGTTQSGLPKETVDEATKWVETEVRNSFPQKDEQVECKITRRGDGISLAPSIPTLKTIFWIMKEGGKEHLPLIDVDDGGSEDVQLRRAQYAT